MPTKEHITEMAAYTRWQNESLFCLCDDLTAEERSADRGMFFTSIEHTLDHILMVDQALLEFATSGAPPQGFDPNRRVGSSYDGVKRARFEFDESLKQMIAGRSASWFDQQIRFHSERHGRERAFPRSFVFAQMFNHGTHHRSQITSELHKLGIDYGNTDMPYNPYSQY